VNFGKSNGKLRGYVVPHSMNTGKLCWGNSLNRWFHGGHTNWWIQHASLWLALTQWFCAHVGKWRRKRVSNFNRNRLQYQKYTNTYVYSYRQRQSTVAVTLPKLLWDKCPEYFKTNRTFQIYTGQKYPWRDRWVKCPKPRSKSIFCCIAQEIWQKYK